MIIIFIIITLCEIFPCKMIHLLYCFISNCKQLCVCIYSIYERVLWVMTAVIITKAFLHSNEGVWRPFIMHYIFVLLWFICFFYLRNCLWPYRITGTHVKLEQHKWVYISILCVCCVAVLGALRHFNLIFEQSMSILYNINLISPCIFFLNRFYFGRGL